MGTRPPFSEHRLKIRLGGVGRFAVEVKGGQYRNSQYRVDGGHWVPDKPGGATPKSTSADTGGE